MSAACAGCGFGNRDGARFCSGCGRSLATACSACGAGAAAGERFCNQCGAALGTPAAAVNAPDATSAPRDTTEGERKQVTVLFADVARSMDLAERLDPDELSQVMQGLFEVCREAVEHFGGTVDKFTGDGVMALFGAPVAQEDHARRACHAALRLVGAVTTYALTLRQRGIELQMRVGLNSGDVVAGSVGEAFTAVGHTVGLAQRMESLAKPGIPYLSEHTAALAADGFLLRGLGKTAVKGSTIPVGVFALEAATGGSSEAGRRRSGSAHLVGRDSELATLLSALEGAETGRAQVIGIVGEAGAGKSRLCEELAKRAAVAGVTVRRTAGVSHAQAVPLLPILGFMRDYFNVTHDDSPEQIREKVRDRLLHLDQAFEPDLALVFDFLEVPDPASPAPQLGPDARISRVLDVFRRATERRSELQTLLLILEDLHWFDPRSVAFLEAWLPSFPGTRTLIVTNFRPEFHASWMGSSYYRQLPLAPLDDRAVAELLGHLLGSDPALSTVARQLQARAGGNPFFAEEIVRGLATDGTLTGQPGAYSLARPAAEVRVPPTVQAVLASRIDQLSARDKAVLQAAAVIGRTFTTAILGAVVGEGPDPVNEALQGLCAAELLQATGTLSEYRFWHPLTQEVAYGTLLAATRRRHHAAVARALIGTEPERRDEVAALVATHFEAAEDHLEAARWQLMASNRALSRDMGEAQRRCRSSLEHLAGIPSSDEALALFVRTSALLLRLGSRAGMDAAEADRLLTAARPAADRLGDAGLLVGLSIAAGSVRTFAGDPAGGRERWSEACCLADLNGDRVLRAFARHALGFAHIYTGPLGDGLAITEELLRLCGTDPSTGLAQAGYSVHDTAHWVRSRLCALSGRLDEAQRLARAALVHYEQRPMAEWHAWTLSQFADLTDLTGEAGEHSGSERSAAEALQLAGDSGNTSAAVKALEAAGIGALLAGRPDEAAGRFSDALAEARKHRSGLMEEAAILAHVSRAYLALGDVPAARAAADEAILVAQRQQVKVVECFAQLVRARVWRETATGDADLAEARAAVDAGDALAAATGALTYAAFLAEERARLDGDPAALYAAAEGYAAIGATGHARRLHDELAAQ